MVQMDVTRVPCPPSAELLDGLVTAVLLLDHRRWVYHLNSAAEELLTISAERARGQLAEHLLGVRAPLQSAVTAASKGQSTTFREIEIGRGVSTVGSEKPMLVDCTVSPFPAGVDSPWVLVELAVCQWLTVMATDRTTMLEDLPIKFSADTMGAKKAGEGWQQSLQRSVERRLAIGEANLLSQLAPEFERVLLKTVFAFTGGRKREAARWLGWGRNTLTRKLKELDVD